MKWERGKNNMTDKEWLEITELYNREFPVDMPFVKISEKLEQMNTHPQIHILRSIFCDRM